MPIHEITITLTSEKEIELQYIGTKTPFIPQPAGEQSCRITITDAIDALDEAIDAKEDISLKYLREREEYSTASVDPIVIADITTGEDARNGREDDQWRAVQMTSDRAESPSYSVGYPESAVSHLEIDGREVSGDRIDIWVGEGYIGFTTAATVDVSLVS